MRSVLMAGDDTELEPSVRYVRRALPGVKITLVRSGAAARRATALQVPDLLITDWLLGDGDASGLIEDLTARSPALPVILAATSMHAAAAHRTLATACWKLLIKPYGWGELLELMEESLCLTARRQLMLLAEEGAPCREAAAVAEATLLTRPFCRYELDDSSAEEPTMPGRRGALSCRPEIRTALVTDGGTGPCR